MLSMKRRESSKALVRSLTRSSRRSLASRRLLRASHSNNPMVRTTAKVSTAAQPVLSTCMGTPRASLMSS